MHMIIEYNGKSYKSKDTKETTAQQVVDDLWPGMDEIDRLKIDLDDGSTLLIGKDAVRRCVIRVVPTPLDSPAE